jgi:ACT domain-containing protein
MKTAARSIRINKATEVLRLANGGSSIVAACKKVGISRSSFYEICNNEAELFGDLQERLTETNREALIIILAKRNELLCQIIRDALSDEATPMERLMIFKEMEKQLEKLIRMVRLEDGDNEAAADVLGGPILFPGTSRFVVSST